MRDMRYDKDGGHTLDEDLKNIFEKHGWEWIETTLPQNPDFKKTRTATWIIKAKAKK